ncbi:MAG: hypothetical protein KGO96_12330 [Elusimicrobia bacterium]|nr:hypothetical protein [Elusimicrobiota bacterium]
MLPTIHLAYSRIKGGFTAFSVEVYPPDYRGRVLRSGIHISTADTLGEAQADIQRKIREDWLPLGRALPPMADKGRVARAIGIAGLF